MDMVNVIQNLIDYNDNIKDPQEYILTLIEQLEFIYDLYSDDDSDDDYISEVFTDDEDNEPFTDEELQALNNIEVGQNGEFYFQN
tara:strand:+ start:6160 stop:6414 length:255 start_codon:yes stop_codon:yes gene_type:complete